MGFVDELHQEAQHATKKAEGLEAQLHQEAQLHAKHTKNLQKELERYQHLRSSLEFQSNYFCFWLDS